MKRTFIMTIHYFRDFRSFTLVYGFSNSCASGNFASVTIMRGE